MEVERTLYLARKLDLDVSRESVKKVVRSCLRCQCIDPVPTTYSCGEISIDMNWKQLAVNVTHYRQLPVNVTHYRQLPYLCIVDCEPSWFAI